VTLTIPAQNINVDTPLTGVEPLWYGRFKELEAFVNALGLSGTSGGKAWTNYTPTITPSTGAFTSVAAQGRYFQIGKTIHVAIRVVITTNGTAAGYVAASLPFPVSTNLVYWAFAGREVAATGKMLQAQVGPGSSVAIILNYDNTYPGANGFQLTVSGTYEAA
jgi:hypothetical protein